MNDFKLDDKTKIRAGFKTPEGYFDNFSDMFFSKLPIEETKVIPLSKPLKTWFFAAAAILLLMLSVPLYNHYKLNQDDIDAATLENYLAYHSTVSEEDIVNLLDEKDLEKINIDLKIQDRDIEEALDSNTDLEQYILN